RPFRRSGGGGRDGRTGRGSSSRRAPPARRCPGRCRHRRPAPAARTRRRRAAAGVFQQASPPPSRSALLTPPTWQLQLSARSNRRARVVVRGTGSNEQTGDGSVQLAVGQTAPSLIIISVSAVPSTPSGAPLCPKHASCELTSTCEDLSPHRDRTALDSIRVNSASPSPPPLTYGIRAREVWSPRARRAASASAVPPVSMATALLSPERVVAWPRTA